MVLNDQNADWTTNTHYRTTNNGLERPKMLTERPIPILERPMVAPFKRENKI